MSGPDPSDRTSWVTDGTTWCRRLVDYMVKNFAFRAGGERVVKQQTESLDQCIAARKVLEPEMRGWLGGVKIPRPATPPKATTKTAKKK